MLDNDPRYLRPESRIEMDQRITSLSVSPSRRRRKKKRSPARPLGVDTVAELSEETICDSSVYGLESANTEGSDSHTIDEIKEGILQNLHPDLLLTPDSVPEAVDLGIPNRRMAPMTAPPSMSPPSLAATSMLTSNPYRTSRRASVFSGATSVSTSSIRDLQKRVSGCSTRYAQQISTLLKNFTISSASDVTQRPPSSERRPSICSTDALPPESELEVFEAFPEVGYALPGDFIDIQKLNCAGFPGQDHYGGKCWCSIADAVATEQSSWLLPTGELSSRALQMLSDPSKYNLAARDCFGNTPLHLFAALEGYEEALFGMVLNSPELRATNNAGQTFLHVLNIDWFSGLARASAPLKQLLAYLRYTAPDMVYLNDVYGRTFFHRVHSLIRDSEILDGILSPFNPALSSRRDAFGFNPLANTNLGGEGPFIPPRRIGVLTPLPEEIPTSSKGRNNTPRASAPNEMNSGDAFVVYHARLLQIIQASYDNPRIEDEEGRNGLHCLAEAIINQQTMHDTRTALSTGRTQSHLKRKWDVRNNTPEGVSASEGPLASRLRHLEGLLLRPSSAQPTIDVNHYDKLGNTVFMSFIAHLPDDQEDKAKTLSNILELLLRAGARIEGRNRRGETALLVAARLGRKIALTTLLEHGANVHVRDVDGRGVLQVIDATCRQGAARDDVALYARLEACRVLLTGKRDWGVVQAPGVLQEWRSRGCE